MTAKSTYLASWFPDLFQEFFNPKQKNIQFTDDFADSFASDLQVKHSYKIKNAACFKRNIQNKSLKHLPHKTFFSSR